MKALTIWQPWASLIVARFKLWETRSWPTNHRGLLAIHAAKKQPAETLLYFNGQDRDLVVMCLAHMGISSLEQITTGAVLGIVRVTNCVRADYWRDSVSVLDRILGDWGPDRYAWRFRLVERFAEPILARGRQGLWDWEPPEPWRSINNSDPGSRSEEP